MFRVRSLRFGLAVLAVSLIAVVALGPPASAHGEEEQSAQDRDVLVPNDGVEEVPGLGRYGRSGPIGRSDLAPDLAVIVSDRALDMAASPALAEARQSWDRDLDFVGQVDYQLRFRGQVDYMSTDAQHLGDLLSRRPNNFAIRSLGLFMTGRELAEFQRRQRVGDNISQVRRALGEGVKEGGDTAAVQHGPNFGGVWQDQLGGGDVIIALVDPSQADFASLRQAVGPEGTFRVVEVEHSWDEINTFRDRLLARVADTQIEALVPIHSTGEGRRLEIVTPTPSLIDERFFIDVPEDIVTVTKGEAGGEDSGPSYTHSAADQQAGLQFESDPGYAAFCTWGLSGHTSSYNYVVTAGHCGATQYEDNDSPGMPGWSYVFEADQNDVFALTPGPTYVYSWNRYNKDAKRFSSQYADNNCYHAGAHCAGFFWNRAWHNTQDVWSDMTCASLGTSNRYECGWVAELNFKRTTGTCQGDRWLRHTLSTMDGDSGSGLVYPTSSGGKLTIDGIHVCSDGVYGSLRWAQTAYDVKRYLAFDFNCENYAVNARSASSWGSCPGYSR